MNWEEKRNERQGNAYLSRQAVLWGFLVCNFGIYRKSSLRRSPRRSPRRQKIRLSRRDLFANLIILQKVPWETLSIQENPELINFCMTSNTHASVMKSIEGFGYSRVNDQKKRNTNHLLLKKQETGEVEEGNTRYFSKFLPLKWRRRRRRRRREEMITEKTNKISSAFFHEKTLLDENGQNWVPPSSLVTLIIIISFLVSKEVCNHHRYRHHHLVPSLFCATTSVVSSSLDLSLFRRNNDECVTFEETYFLRLSLEVSGQLLSQLNAFVTLQDDHMPVLMLLSSLLFSCLPPSSPSSSSSV